MYSLMTSQTKCRVWWLMQIQDQTTVGCYNNKLKLLKIGNTFHHYFSLNHRNNNLKFVREFLSQNTLLLLETWNPLCFLWRGWKFDFGFVQDLITRLFIHFSMHNSHKQWRILAEFMNDFDLELFQRLSWINNIVTHCSNEPFMQARVLYSWPIYMFVKNKD